MRTAIPFVTASMLLAAQAASAQVVFLDTFGNTATRQTSPYVPQMSGAAGTVGHYVFAQPNSTTNDVIVTGPTTSVTITPSIKNQIRDATFAVINPQDIMTPIGSAVAGPWWRRGAYPLTPGLPETGDSTTYRDHTGDAGAVLVVNAGLVTSDMYRRAVTLTPGTYTMSVWRFMIQTPTNIHFSLREADDSVQLATSSPFILNNIPLAEAAPRTWQQLTWTFTVPSTCAASASYSVAMTNNLNATSGNDLFFDDISLTKVADDPSATPAACATSTNGLTPLPDAGLTNENQPVTIDVRANDTTTPSGVSLKVPTQATPPANGTVSIDPITGLVTYTPNPGYKGTDSFTYEVCTEPSAALPNTLCKTATVTISVLGVIAQPDSAVSPNGDPVKINIVANDSSSDPTNAPLNPLATPVTPPQHGTVVYNADGTATYTPNPGYVGADSFEYQICTVQGPYAQPACATTTVTVTVAVAVTSAQPVPINNVWALLALVLAMGGLAWTRRRA